MSPHRVSKSLLGTVCTLTPITGWPPALLPVVHKSWVFFLPLL
ncbi:rCG37851, isoform CRA_a [Rattus norvegicus]|uniref:RCG37851, isoform CRA_a n=1 Tax=Rattus norvegicus TaxID=10116 RepID=A6K652_RAT|nr:rCG37851, isoform CRA_a [Rattus norvegicus]